MFLCIFPTFFFPRNPKIITIFFPKKIFKYLFNFEIIFFLFNSDVTQTLIFRMFCMLIEYFMLVFMIPVDSSNKSIDLDYFALGKLEENELSKVRLGMIESYLDLLVRVEETKQKGPIF